MSMTLKTTKHMCCGLSVVFKITARRSTIHVRKKSDLSRKNRTTGSPAHVRKIWDWPQPGHPFHTTSMSPCTHPTHPHPQETYANTELTFNTELTLPLCPPIPPLRNSSSVPWQYDGRALSGNPGLQYPHLHGPVHTPDNNRWDTSPVLFIEGLACWLTLCHMEKMVCNFTNSVQISFIQTLKICK